MSEICETKLSDQLIERISAAKIGDVLLVTSEEFDELNRQGRIQDDRNPLTGTESKNVFADCVMGGEPPETMKVEPPSDLDRLKAAFDAIGLKYLEDKISPSLYKHIDDNLSEESRENASTMEMLREGSMYLTPVSEVALCFMWAAFSFDSAGKFLGHWVWDD